MENQAVLNKLLVALAHLNQDETKANQISQTRQGNLINLAKNSYLTLGHVASLLVGTKLSLNQCSKVLQHHYQSLNDFVLNSGFDAQLFSKSTPLIQFLNLNFNGLGNQFYLLNNFIKTFALVKYTKVDTNHALTLAQNLHQLLTKLYQVEPDYQTTQLKTTKVDLTY